jgi:membrane-associated phospholipid phosphatase
MRSRWPAVVLCALATVVLGLFVAGDHSPSVLDPAVDGWPHGLLVALVQPTEPSVLVPVLALLVVWCGRARRPWDAAFVVLGPGIAVVLATGVLKPLFDRWKGDTLVYPSGHTVGMVATVVVVCVLFPGPVRTATAAAGAVLLVGVTIGMIGLGYHYLPDVVGGASFAVAGVLTVHAVLPRTGAGNRSGIEKRWSRGRS